MVRRAARKPDAVAAELEGLGAANGKDKEGKEGKLNLGDGSALKRALDDAAVAALEGYTEDFSLSNLKIAVGIFTCGLAALSHFYPKKYPDNFWVLVLCVILYAIATVVLSYVLGSIEGDIFFVSRPKGGRVLFLASQLPRYSEQYTLMVGSKRSKWSRQSDRPDVKFETSVTRWFDTEGSLLEEDFREAVLERVRQFERVDKKTS